jgi:hypothetical protein
MNPRSRIPLQLHISKPTCIAAFCFNYNMSTQEQMVANTEPWQNIAGISPPTNYILPIFTGIFTFR